MSPSGKVHLQFWKTAWALPVGLSASFLIPVITTSKFGFLFISLGVLAGYGLGYFIDPDLDLVGTTSAEGRMLKIPVLGWFMVAYWTIYGAAFRKHHRSIWTHGYVLSTVIRFAYTFWWMLLIPSMHIHFGLGLFGAFIGLCVSDGIHIWADTKYGDK